MTVVVKPVTVSGAVRVSTTATDATAAWSAVTTYAAGALVQHATRIWESAAGSNLNHEPGVALTWWTDKGPTNDWAMFDNQASTATTRASSLEVVIAPGAVNALGLAGLVGDALRVRLRDGAGGTLVREWTVNLDAALISDWYQYYFEPDAQRAEVLLLDVPPYHNGHVEVLVTGSGTVAVGVLSVGAQFWLGDTYLGASATLLDYSRKEADGAGVTLLEPGAWAKRVTLRTELPRGQMAKVFAVLAALRGQACFWSGVGEEDAFTPLTVFGFCRDFQQEIAYQTTALCSIEVEGMTV